MNLVRRLDHLIHFLAQRKYLVPAGLVLGGLILFSLVLGSFRRARKKDYK
jgi:hypothetical protein